MNRRTRWFLSLAGAVLLLPAGLAALFYWERYQHGSGPRLIAPKSRHIGCLEFVGRHQPAPEGYCSLTGSRPPCPRWTAS